MRDAPSVLQESGFSLIQISIILTVAALLMVAVLPTPQAKIKRDAASVTRMNTLITALRQYQVANAALPCPADPTQPVGSQYYGVASTNTGTTNNCVTGTAPNAAYADSTNHIAIGMVPVQSLGLSYEYALDGYGRDITYAVDTSATGCWATSSLPGGITVNDNGNIHNSVVALVSHGQDGYGAWLPLAGTSGSALRFNNGSTDNTQADNAQVQHGGGLIANGAGQFASFVNQSATPTFDDYVVYKSSQWNMNALPLHNPMPTITPPANGMYAPSNVLTFTLTFPSAVTVTGTPRLALSALGTGKLGNGVSPYISYATYQSGSGTNTLTFSYTVQSNDSAPTSGLTMAASIDLNGGTISGAPTLCFFAPNLSGVLIGQLLYAVDGQYNRVVVLTTSGTFVRQIGCASGHCAASSANGSFSNPQDVAVDSNGNIWVSDYNNSRIEEFDSNGNYKGNATGYTGTYPGAMIIDPSTQNLLVITANSGDTSNVIDRFNTNTGSRIAEYSETSGSGCGKLSSPDYIAADTSGNIWITQYSSPYLQKFSSTLVYQSICKTTGFSNAHGVYVDSSNYVYVADPTNKRINKFDTSGNNVNSFSGGTKSYLTNAALSGPYPLTVDSSGNIWVYDASNNNIQEYSSTGTLLNTISTFNGGDTFGVNGGSGIGVTGITLSR